MITARELMNPQTPSLSFDSSVGDAIAFFQHRPQAFAIVSASRDRLHGVLTEGQLMKIFLRHQSQPAKDALIFYRDCFEPAQLVQETEIFHEVVRKVMTSVGHRVFVIDMNGELVGHITAKDLLPVLAGQKPVSTSSAVETTPVMPSPAPGVAFDELKSQLYLFESFFTKSPFMMHSVNPSGYIQMANETLHQILGYEYGELIGKTIYDLYPKSSHDEAKAGIQQILENGFHQVLQVKMVHREGRQIEVEMASRALADPWKNPIGTMTVSRPLKMELLLELL